jgi:hypothetical protein
VISLLLRTSPSTRPSTPPATGSCPPVPNRPTTPPAASRWCTRSSRRDSSTSIGCSCIRRCCAGVALLRAAGRPAPPGARRGGRVRLRVVLLRYRTHGAPVRTLHLLDDPVVPLDNRRCRVHRAATATTNVPTQRCVESARRHPDQRSVSQFDCRTRRFPSRAERVPCRLCRRRRGRRRVRCGHRPR